MDETTNGHVPPAGQPWRSVCIASPRPLNGRKFAMMLDRKTGEETIARDVTIAEALVVALEFGREHAAAMFYRDRGDLREYVIGRCRIDGGAFEPVLRGVVARTGRIEAV